MIKFSVSVSAQSQTKLVHWPIINDWLDRFLPALEIKYRSVTAMQINWLGSFPSTPVCVFVGV